MAHTGLSHCRYAQKQAIRERDALGRGRGSPKDDRGNEPRGYEVQIMQRDERNIW
jgi:hypothetical protein